MNVAAKVDPRARPRGTPSPLLPPPSPGRADTRAGGGTIGGPLPRSRLGRCGGIPASDRARRYPPASGRRRRGAGSGGARGVARQTAGGPGCGAERLAAGCPSHRGGLALAFRQRAHGPHRQLLRARGRGGPRCRGRRLGPRGRRGRRALDGGASRGPARAARERLERGLLARRGGADEAPRERRHVEGGRAFEHGEIFVEVAAKNLPDGRVLQGRTDGTATAPDPPVAGGESERDAAGRLRGLETGHGFGRGLPDRRTVAGRLSGLHRQPLHLRGRRRGIAELRLGLSPALRRRCCRQPLDEDSCQQSRRR
mmetsp:Transcript_135001/g.431297  ORF Transcript_135001/g.431297 Transcript_135001/m.431297 type:complete len:312 (+) Transcript_135001:77-1012(+)